MGVARGEGNQHLWDQFCKLGEMMGDGLHHEADGKWISKEYRKLSRILIKPDPAVLEWERKVRIEKNKRIDDKMIVLLEKNPCKCGGKLKQSRSGSKVCYCDKCKSRYKAKSVKKK